MEHFKNQTSYKNIRDVLEILCNNKDALLIKKMPQSPNNTADKYVMQKVLEMQTEFKK